MDYTTLSLLEVRTALTEIAGQTEELFGKFDGRQLNWRPGSTQWSVGQCFEHLMTSNRLMLTVLDDALKGRGPRNIWARLPVLPGVMGRMLIRSQARNGSRKFTAPPQAQPSTTSVAADIIQRFVDQQREIAERLGALDEQDASRTIMTSPFVRFITYSVLDGCRLVVAHEQRHVEQARRVTVLGAFPARDRIERKEQS